MNQMNMPGMNPGAGGPVGGVPMMNNGSSAPRNESNSNANTDVTTQLNTYIYDYFLKKGYHDCARALVQDDAVQLNATKSSRRDGEQVNGVDGDAMLTDSKEDVKKIPDDLPRPNLSGEQHQTSFLLDWWILFWEVFSAQRKKGRGDALQYVQYTQNMLRMREQQLPTRQGMMPNNQYAMRQMRPGMPPNLQKSVLQNNNQNLTPQQMAQFKNQQAQMVHHQMQREQSDLEMNGQRPQSPSSVENAPSPSKRPRLDGSQANGQQMTPNGRAQGQPMPGQYNSAQTQAMLMQHGINPRQLTPAQYQQLSAQNPSVQQKSLQAMPTGLMNPGVMPGQEMMPLADAQGGLLQMQEYAQLGQMRTGMPNPGGQGGNHALQDYQMQLMLLEQQNKRRLLMARQEQDRSGDGSQPGMSGQGNLPPHPGTSPQDSRTGGSPNPSEQMKRGTPKLPQNGLPGSPNVGDATMAGQGRSSPASMNFGGQMPQDMGGAAFFNMKGQMPEGAVGPNGMRPPSSNPAFSGPHAPQPMDAMSRPPQGPGTANRVPSGNWQQGPQGQQPQPMLPQQQPGGPVQPAGTPQERNAMPPPQAPPVSASTSNATGRTQTSSPQPGAAAPPTPQQANKPAPKSKKEGAEKARKRPPKKNAAANAATTAATPSSEAEPPPTPTTPITPMNPNSFNKNAASNPQQPTSAPAPQSLVQPPQQPPQQPQQQPQQPPQQPMQQDPSQTFGDMTVPDANGFNLDFTTLDNPDLLEFDFDTFLNTDDASAFTFEGNLPYPPDGVEAGAGDGL